MCMCVISSQMLYVCFYEMVYILSSYRVVNKREYIYINSLNLSCLYINVCYISFGVGIPDSVPLPQNHVRYPGNKWLHHVIPLLWGHKSRDTSQLGVTESSCGIYLSQPSSWCCGILIIWGMVCIIYILSDAVIWNQIHIGRSYLLFCSLISEALSCDRSFIISILCGVWFTFLIS